MVRRAALTRTSGAILLGILLAASISIVRDTDQSSLLLRGDFPAFYAAGKIVAQGRGGELYNPELQLSIEQEAWPSFGPQNFYAFAYPPYVALFFVPFSALPPQAAKLLWTALMLGTLIGAAYILARDSAQSTKQITLLFLSCTPVFIGIMSGQNVALSMLCYTILLSPRYRNRPAPGGYAVGLWCFKPHFGLAAAAALFLAGRTRQIIIAGGIMAMLYILGSIIYGLNWPTAWFLTAQGFAALDYEANSHQQISLYVVLTLLGTKLTGDAWIAQTIGIGSGVLLGLHLSYEFIRAGRGEREMDQALLLLGPGIVLLSPHTMFYDAGIAAVSAVAAVERRILSMRVIAGVWLFLCAARLFQEALPADPLGILALALYCVLCRQSTRGEPL